MDAAVEFLEKLADLCEQYDGSFAYTNRDDGIHVQIGGRDIAISDSIYSAEFVRDLRKMATESSTPSPQAR